MKSETLDPRDDLVLVDGVMYEVQYRILLITDAGMPEIPDLIIERISQRGAQECLYRNRHLSEEVETEIWTQLVERHLWRTAEEEEDE
jgi:hypothetical protein